MTYEEMKKKRQKISQATEATIENMEVIACETARTSSVLNEADEILKRLNNEFEQKTGLTKIDATFLFVAVALQLLRQYLVTNFKERKDDQEEAKKRKKSEEHSNRAHRYYNPSLKQIKENPVPFDALNGAEGALEGGGIFKHRGATLGHDPILGLVFGTANIATSTLTTKKLKSYHITTKNKKDFFGNRASTALIFKKTADKIMNEGSEGKEKVFESLKKEILHLCTDVYSKDSLPLPFLSLIDGIIDTEFASGLAKHGLDMANVLTVGKQITYTIVINTIIAMLHGMLYKGNTNEEQKHYEVRTRKILMYSNVIAASSNALVVALTKQYKYLDIGGIGVAIYRLITDIDFIYNVKRDFVFGNFDKMIEGEKLKLKIIDDDFNIIN